MKYYEVIKISVTKNCSNTTNVEDKVLSKKVEYKIVSMSSL